MSNRNRKGAEIDEQIVGAANRLFQERGYGNTSFQDLAAASGVPKGNFYHYYRSKDDVLEAVIRYRIDALDAHIRAAEAASAAPVKRILALVQALLRDPSDPLSFGCPHGSLCLELAKGKPDLLATGVRTLDRLRRWFAGQFRIAGVAGNPDHLALTLMARIQGIIVIGAAFRDKAFAGRELDQTRTWIESVLPARSAAKKSKALTH